jgi:hypothetical protein
MTQDIERQIDLANEVKNRFGYITQVVIVKSGERIGFIFDDTKNVGDVFLNNSNEKCEVLAVA